MRARGESKREKRGETKSERASEFFRSPAINPIQRARLSEERESEERSKRDEQQKQKERIGEAVSSGDALRIEAAHTTPSELEEVSSIPCLLLPSFPIDWDYLSSSFLCLSFALIPPIRSPTAIPSRSASLKWVFRSQSTEQITVCYFPSISEQNESFFELQAAE